MYAIFVENGGGRYFRIVRKLHIHQYKTGGTCRAEEVSRDPNGGIAMFYTYSGEGHFTCTAADMSNLNLDRVPS